MKPMSRGRSTPMAGFTLIELLVVISIISLLISILLPALSAARQSARTIKCASQIRQMALMVELYRADYNAFYPPVWTDRAYPFGGPWPEILFTYHDAKAVTWRHTMYIDNIYFCPEVDEGLQPEPATGQMIAGTEAVSYGYNRFGMGGDSRHFGGGLSYGGLKRELPSPTSETLMFVDNMRPDYNTRSGFYAADANPASIWTRHMGGTRANVVFADSHTVTVADEVLRVGNSESTNLAPWFGDNYK